MSMYNKVRVMMYKAAKGKCTGNCIHHLYIICASELCIETPRTINPSTLRVSLESIVCYFRTFVNNSGIKQKLSKYLKESCRLTSG